MTKEGEFCTTENILEGVCLGYVGGFVYPLLFNIFDQQWDRGWDLQSTYHGFFPAFM